MIGCTRCGRWHLDAEKFAGKSLSCTDVKQYWGKIREEHFQSEGHLPRIITDDDGDWICMKCRKKLFSN
jgi:hypothetical protein